MKSDFSRQRIIHINPLPSDFKDYLSNSKNKSDFVTFFLDFMINNAPKYMKESQEFFIGKIDGTTWEVTATESSEIVELACDREEADSRMFVYAAYLCNNQNLNRLIILSPDTDVIIIAFYYYYNSINAISKHWFITGNGYNKRFIPIHSIADSLGASICSLLPIFHCLTGCDSTASFSGVGKRKAFKVLKEKKNDILSLHDLGDNPVPDANDGAIWLML